MGYFSEIAIEIYEEVESLMVYTYYSACVIVAYERNMDVQIVMDLTEELDIP